MKKRTTYVFLVLILVVFLICETTACSGSSNSNDTRNKCLGCGKTILWSDNYCYECQYKMGLTN